MPNRFQIQIAANLLLVRDGQVLLAKRKNTGWGDGLYSLVGGHLEGNELPTVALAREVKEEIGISVKPDDLTLKHIMYMFRPDHERMQMAFEAKNFEGEPTNLEPEKCEELRWFPLKKLPTNMTGYSRSVLTDYDNNIIYNESDDRSKE